MSKPESIDCPDCDAGRVKVVCSKCANWIGGRYCDECGNSGVASEDCMKCLGTGKITRDPEDDDAI